MTDLIKFDDQTPQARIDTPQDNRKLAFSNLAALSALPLVSYGLFAGGLGAISVLGIINNIMLAPLVVKAPFVISSFLYAATHKARVPKKVKGNIPRVSGWKIPIGKTIGKKWVTHDFAAIPHMLVSGTTGGGKTVAIKGLLYNLIRTHDPDELEVHIIDMKGGASFAEWTHIPHVKSVIRTSGEAKQTLEHVAAEMFRRLDVLSKKRKAFERDPKFPRILVVIDEGAELSPKFAIGQEQKKIKQECMVFLSEVARIGREPCIHLLYATQKPSEEALPVTVRELMDAKLVFRQGERSSQLSLGEGNIGAAKLSDVRGRMLYVNCGKETEVQGLYVPDDRLREWIRSYIPVQSGETDSSSIPADNGDNGGGFDGSLSMPSNTGIWE